MKKRKNFGQLKIYAYRLRLPPNKHQNNDVCHIKKEEANKQSLLFYGSGIEN